MNTIFQKSMLSPRAVLLSFSLAFFLFGAFAVFAQIEIDPPTGTATFIDLVKKLAQFLRDIGIPIAVIMILYAGLVYMTAAGNPKRIQLAHSIFIWSLLVLAILLIGSGIATMVCKFLGGASC